MTVLLDARAKKVLKTILVDHSQKWTLNSISKKYHMNFVMETNRKKIPKRADYAFELFYGGRSMSNPSVRHDSDMFTKHHYIGSSTVNIISDTMHGHRFDEVRFQLNEEKDEDEDED